MSEGHDGQAPEPTRPEATAATPPPRRRSTAVAWLIIVLVLLIAGVAASPFWAPAVAPLLPWSGPQQPEQEKELAARVERLEGLTPRIDKLQAQIDRLGGLSARVEKLEGNASRPDKSGEFSARLDRIEAALKDQQQRQAGTTDAAAQKLDQRLTAVEARLAAPPSESPEAQQQIEKLAATANTLATRLEAIEKAVRVEATADQTDTGLLLILLQMRDAIAAGRPFAAEYDAFAALAHDRPEVAKAAAPLAGAAQSGVAGREVLRDQLHTLAAHIADAKPPPSASDWRGQVWARMRSLVTIRRIGGAGQSAPDNAVNEAQRDLAQGDLAAAVGKLKTLTGAHAEAAKPWIDMAETRLATDRALQRIEQLLTQRLAASHKPGQP